MKDTLSDETGADLIGDVSIKELMPPMDPRALAPKILDATPVIWPTQQEERLSVAGIDEEPPTTASAPVVPTEKGPFIIIIQHKTKKTLHAMTLQHKGPGVLASFKTRAEAVAAQERTPACKNNWSTILSVL